MKAVMCAEKFPLVSMGDRVEGQACLDLGARTPIGASRNLPPFYFGEQIIKGMQNVRNATLYGQSMIMSCINPMQPQPKLN